MVWYKNMNFSKQKYVHIRLEDGLLQVKYGETVISKSHYSDSGEK